ncbi:DUF3316 domain-containing protein [Muribaculum sp. NM65_B17]|uniref:DUF3316 domain-containing protein n=1 Tax=Muribaculum sp. NM65_B17 TaxID=2516961 RepID=UPI00109374E3|nr:DUF3316 domain-containing protein [Muribaculum sp. NM65_B17]TGY04686.1 DUF3316 domain-containing protein [Muribaculum sp. NM65_B17]THG43994.1 DUF3316 domain-containing protein [Muribaculaceae bacterium]
MTRLLLSILCVMLSAMAFAQDEPTTLRPVTSSYTYEIGGATLANTYLTPLKYKGWDMALNYERMQAMKFNPEKWVMRLTAGIDLNRTDNPAKNATMWRLVADFSWGMTYRFKLPHNITLAGGGSTSLDLGCVYNARNGNNPVAVEAAWTVNLTGYASWNVKIGRLPVTLRYQPTIPLTGVFFSPDYGELFYEIYLGNHSGLAHCAWWGNYFRMENLVTADMHLGATSLRVGFRNNILSTSINDITTRTITYSAVIGVTTEWISLNPSRKADNNARIISALY